MTTIALGRQKRSGWPSSSAPGAVLPSTREGVVRPSAPTHPEVLQSSGEVLSLVYRSLDERPAHWLQLATEDLQGLVRGGHVQSIPALESFWRVFVQSAGVWTNTPRPFLAPRSDGGLSAEFQAGQIELQLDFCASGDVLAYSYDGSTEWEGPLNSLPYGVEKWVWRLAIGAR